MNRKGAIGLGTILMLIVGIVFVMAMIEPISQQTALMTKKNPITNETIVVPRNASTTLINESVTRTLGQSAHARSNCHIDNIAVVNSLTGGAFTENTDYVFTSSTGVIRFINTNTAQMANTTNDTRVSYNFCQSGYADNSATRGIIGIILIMSGLAIIAYCVYWVFKDADWKFA